jgi:hypothetical protein
VTQTENCLLATPWRVLRTILVDAGADLNTFYKRDYPANAEKTVSLYALEVAQQEQHAQLFAQFSAKDIKL